MCNLYSVTTNIEALRALAGMFEIADDIGNFPPQTGVYPDYPAPVIRNRYGRRELTKMRWGLPSSHKALYEAAQKRAQKREAKEGRSLTPEEFAELVRLEPDAGTTNVRNTASQHWRRWLGPENRCVVPFTSFAEYDNSVGPDGKKRGNTWFARDASRPLAVFAGIWVPAWTSVRKISRGLETADLFGFLTCPPNALVGAIHLKAMPVVLTTPDEVATWLSAPWSEAAALQRPLPDDALAIVAVGRGEDGRDAA